MNTRKLLCITLAFLLLAGLLPPAPARSAPLPEWPNLLASDMDAGIDAGMNPFVISSAPDTDGSTSIVYLQGGNPAVEFKDESTSGNAKPSSFSREFGASSSLVGRINDIYARPAGSPAVHFVLQFAVERTAASTGPVPGDIAAALEFANFGDVTVGNEVYSVPRFPVPKTSIYGTAAYIADEPSGYEVAQPVNDDDMLSLRFAIVPNGGARIITKTTLRFTVRVENGASAEAYVVDDIGLYEVTPPIVQSLTLNASVLTLAPHSTQQMSVTGLYSDGTSTDVTADAQYASSNESVFTVSAGGLLTAEGAGTARLTAEYGGTSVAADVTVTPDTPISLRGEFGQRRLTEGELSQVRLYALYANSPEIEVTGQAVVASGDSSVVAASPGGQLTALRMGSAVIAAEYAGMRTEAVISVAKANPSGHLAAYWDFDQTDGGTVYDLSGNGNDGVLHQAVFLPEGRRNGALSFDGNGAYVDAGNAANIDYSGGLTVALWVKPQGMRIKARFLSHKGAYGTTGGYSLGYEANLSRYYFDFANADTPETYSTYYGVQTVQGAWDHYALTWSPSSKLFIAYRNGMQLGVSGSFSGPPSTVGRSLLIGSMMNIADFAFQGLIDEVRIYNKDMTAADIAAIYGDLPPIAVTGVEAAPSMLSLGVGSSGKLTANVLPWNAKNQNIAWKTGNPAIAIVDNAGLVTAVGPGQTYIAVTTEDGGHVAQVPVDTYIVPASAITLNKPALTLDRGRTEKLNATISPPDATDKSVLWSTSNAAVATVDAAGIVKAIAPGSAVIAARTGDGLQEAQTAVTVTNTPVVSVELDRAELALHTGGRETLHAALMPANATDKHLVWHSEDAGIAAVNEIGEVIGLSPGVTVVTVRTADGVLTDTAEVTVTNPYGGEWLRTFALRDYMDFYDFPEELVGYKLSFPSTGVNRNAVKLIDTATGQPIAHEWKEETMSNGRLTQGTLRFRAALQRGGASSYVLLEDGAYTPAFGDAIALTDNGDGTATLETATQAVLVPYGESRYPGGLPFDRAPAPLLGISQGVDDWTAVGELAADQPGAGNSLVYAVKAGPVRHGALSMEYAVEYELGGGRSYRVVLELRGDERHVTIAEYMTGILASNKLYWKLDYTSGLQPNGRLAMTNGGYNAAYSGGYGAALIANGELPYRLGQYAPNSGGLMRATAFWNDNGDDALLFSLYRLEDWRTEGKLVWESNRYPGNLTFYQAGGRQYMRLGLAGQERHWAVSVIPRSDMRITGITPNDARNPNPPLREYAVSSAMSDYFAMNPQFGNGPEAKLFARLTDFSLDAYKDMIFDFPETLEPYSASNAVVKAADFRNTYLREGITQLANRFWDFSAYLGGAAWPRLQSAYYPAYGDSRWSWTDTERMHLRSILVFVAYLNALDTGMPHRSMLGGHPNFILDGKQGLALASGLFPDHPDAAYWETEFLDFYDKWLAAFVRPDNKSLNTTGGRWVENIATYALASLRPLAHAREALLRFGGEDIYDRDGFRSWIGWMMGTLVPAENGVRQLPPQGAHAQDKDLPGGEFAGLLEEIARSLIDGPSAEGVALGERLLWNVTKGAEGVKPDLRSTVYTDYGAVLRYDYGGLNEAYVNIQQLNGRGYRWSTADNGKIYYAAGGRRLSWNAAETSGDSMDLTKLSVLRVGNSSLGEHAADGILYDFDYAQYYKAAGGNAGYLSRNVMMVRDAYLSIYDDVAASQTAGQFFWNNSGHRFQAPLPDIYVLRDGPGDQHRLVASAPLEVDVRPHGAAIRTESGAGAAEYVFSSDTPIVAAGGAGEPSFSGLSGYAGGRRLALFEGSSIALDGFGLSVSGGDFGISGELEASGVHGRIAGRSGGAVTVTLPTPPDTTGCTAIVAGNPVTCTLSNGGATFPIDIDAGSGTVAYTLELDPGPALPIIANGGFEQGTSATADHWTRSTWTGAPTFLRASDVPHGGSFAASLVNGAGSYGAWTKSGVNAIPVSEAAAYEISLWIRTDDVQTGSGYGASFNLQFLDESGASAGSAMASPMTTGTTGWTKVTINATAPPGAATLRIDARLRGSGQAWFDDLTIAAAD